MQIHILQDPLRARRIILEGDVVEVDAAVLYLSRRLAAVGAGIQLGVVIGDGGLLPQHLRDPAGAGDGPGHHHEDHGDHHKRHHDLGDVGEERDELAGLQRTGIHHLAAEPHDGDDGAVNDEHHDGHVDDHHAESLFSVGLQVQISLGKLLPLVVLLHKGLDHPDARQVLLDHQVQRIGLFLHGPEAGACLGKDQHHRHDQHRQCHQKDIAELIADAHGQKQRRHQHHRCPHQQTHGEHQRHLQVVDVVGEPGHQRSGGELLDIGEGIILDMVILRRPQIGAEAHACDGRAGRRAQAKAQRHHGHDDHLDALAQNKVLIAVCDANIHNITHDQWNQQLKHRLRRAAQHAETDPLGIWPRMWPKRFQHCVRSSSRFRMIRSSRFRNSSVSWGVKPRTKTASDSWNPFSNRACCSRPFPVRVISR